MSADREAQQICGQDPEVSDKGIITTKVINQHGADICFHHACNLMDSAIAADMDYGDGLTDQEFFNAYCIRHALKFGDEFELDKRS